LKPTKTWRGRRSCLKSKLSRAESKYNAKRLEFEAQSNQKNEDFERFSTILREYESKKLKASKKIVEERIIIEQKQKELNEINIEIGKQEWMKDTLIHKIKNYEKCHDFLQSVVSRYNDEYHDIPDLLQRYRNLEASISKLKEQNIKYENDLQVTKNENARLEKEMTNEILLLSNEIAILQKQIEVR